VNRDPIGYRGGLNLYGYVLSQPTYYVDPSGLQIIFPVFETVPPFPPVLNPGGPSYGTPLPFPGGSNINIWGEGEAPGFGDYGAAGPDYDDFKETPDGTVRPPTSDLPDNSADVIVCRNSPVIPDTWDEVCRLSNPNSTFTITQPCAAIGKAWTEAVKAMKRLGCKNSAITKPKKTPGPSPEADKAVPVCSFSLKPGDCPCK